MSTPGPSYQAGPDDDSQEAEAIASSSTAPLRSYSKQPFASIEYPSTVSHPSAILKVVSQQDINDCLNSTGTTQEAKTLEMRYKEGDLYAIPVRGLKVPSQKLLMKVTRRRRRVDAQDKGKGKEGAEEGVFTAEIMGPLTQTVRFRGMADFHYTPDTDGRTAQIVGAMRDLDYDAILEYAVPPIDENFTEPISPEEGDVEMDGEDDKMRQNHRSLLDLQAMPVFSDRRLPLLWNYKNHTQAVIEDVVDRRTGLTKQRYINRARHIAYSIPVIGHGAPLGAVPMGPVKGLQERLEKAEKRILEKMALLLDERPIWLRHSFLRQFSDADRRTIVVTKMYLPGFVYSFGAGPFWKCLVRYGYDPRLDPNSRTYQRIYYYLNVARTGPRGQAYRTPEPDEEEEEVGPKSQAQRKTEWEKRQEELILSGKRPPLDPSTDYIFDGKMLQRDMPDFQLCDITDPLIRKYIDDPDLVTDTCTASNGWYKAKPYALIKALTRIKYHHVRDTDEPAPDSICYPAIEEYEKSLLVQGEAEEEEDGEDHNAQEQEHRNEEADDVMQDEEVGDDEAN